MHVHPFSCRVDINVRLEKLKNQFLLSGALNALKPAIFWLLGQNFNGTTYSAHSYCIDRDNSYYLFLITDGTTAEFYTLYIQVAVTFLIFERDGISKESDLRIIKSLILSYGKR